MSDLALTQIMGAIIARVPIILVCTIGLVAVARSKTVPSNAATLAGIGFVCLLVQQVASIGQMLLLPSLRSSSESSTDLGISLAAFGFVQTLLLVVGVTLISIAVFAGRSREI